MATSERSRSILWIDDDVRGLYLSARLLKAEGVSVDVATTARTGLSMAEASPYSLILLDLRLPDASGLDLLKSMTARGVRAPIVMVTGFASLPVAVEAVKCGARDIRAKPFFAEDALDVLGVYGAALAAPGASDDDAARQPGVLLEQLADLAIAQPHLGLRDTARRVGVGRHAVEVAVREQTGQCWREWRRRLVMQRAAECVASSDLPFKAIADQFGYSAIQSFSRAFRAVWGVSPGRYRRDAPPSLRRPTSNGPACS